MNTWSISDTYYTPIDEGFYQDLLEPGVYTLLYNNQGPLLKRESDNFNLPTKIYGINKGFINRVIKTFNTEETQNLGVLLYGTRGSGKSCTAQILCNTLKLPVIVIKGDNKISTFINSIRQDIIVLIDEFEKIYDKRNENSADLLSLLDGLNTVKYKQSFMFNL